MAQVSDFSKGDRVRHSQRGLGTVVAVDRQGVHVHFEDQPGRAVSGIYDEDWFRICEPKGTYLTRATP